MDELGWCHELEKPLLANIFRYYSCIILYLLIQLCVLNVHQTLVFITIDCLRLTVYFACLVAGVLLEIAHIVGCLILIANKRFSAASFFVKALDCPMVIGTIKYLVVSNPIILIVAE